MLLMAPRREIRRCMGIERLVVKFVSSLLVPLLVLFSS